jgi:prepilin signal peptidase PulO-like enzyme (type II secretory pathway)
MIVGFVALAIYDARWFLLPNKIMFPLVGVAAVYWLIQNMIVTSFSISSLGDLALAMLPVTGFYGVMYILSRGKWVGLGDVKFGVVVGLLLPWWGGVAVLVLANTIGSLFILPMIASGKVKRHSQIPFGPMLIVATLVVFFLHDAIWQWISTNLFLI